MAEQQATRLEAARTNSLTRSEEFDHADWTKTATVTADDTTAPDGTATADKVEDTDNASRQSIRQDVSVSDDSLERALSVFVGKRSSGASALFGMRFRGGTTEVQYFVGFDPVTGDIQDRGTGLSGVGANLTRFGVEDFNSDWWRVWMVGANNGSGNTTIRVSCQPAAFATEDGSLDDTLTDFQHLWGAQLEGVSGGASFPSSYIATTSSAVTRAADDLSWGIGFDPQELTVYCKFVERGTRIAAGGTRLFSIDEGLGQVAVRSGGGGYGGITQTSDGAHSTSFIDDNIALGSVIEALLTVDSNFAPTLELSVDGRSTVSASAAGGTMPSSFASPFLWVNEVNGGSRGFNDFIALQIAPGVHDLDAMRSLAGTA